MDTEEFAAKVEGIRGKLYKTAYIYMGSEHAALDALDEAVYRALRACKKLRQPEFFDTWMTRIVINECSGTGKSSSVLTKYLRRQQSALTRCRSRRR